MSRILQVILMIAIILSMILVLPWAFTQTSSLPNFSNTGEIGDTIQGIAGPFISGFSAILVYLAFKEQVTANNLIVTSNREIRLRETENSINEQIRKIPEYSDNFHVQIAAIDTRLGLVHQPFKDCEQAPAFIRAYSFMRFVMIEFELAADMIDSYKNMNFSSPDQVHKMTERIQSTWHVLYKESLRNFFERFDATYERQGGHKDHWHKKDAIKFHFDEIEKTLAQR